MAPPDKPHLTHLFLGGIVDRDGAFDVLASLLLSGSQSLIVDLPRRTIDAAPAANGVTPGLSHSKPLQLPAPKKRDRFKDIEKAPIAKAKREDPQSVLLRGFVAAGGTARPAVLAPTFAKAGYAPTSVYALITKMVTAGALKHISPEKGYRITAKGRKLASGKPAKAAKPAKEPKAKQQAPKHTWTGHPPDDLSQEAFVLKLIADRAPETTTRRQLKEAFAALHMRPESVSVSTTTLKASGAIRTVAQGVYELVPAQPAS